MLNLFAISGVLIASTSSLMALLMFFRGRTRLHYLWGVFCISVVLWGVGAFLIGTTDDPQWANYWWRLTHVGVIFIPALFLHFVYEFLQVHRRWPVVLAYGCALIFLATNLVGDLFIANMRLVFNQFYFDSPPGPAYIPFTAFFFGLVLYSHWKLWLAYRTAHGLRKTQIKYFLFGMGTSFAGGSLSFLPVYGIDLYPVLNIAASFYPLIIGYAIMKHRLMDIRIVVRQAILYFSLMVFVYTIFYAIAASYHAMWGSVFARQGFIVGIFLAFLFAVSFQRYQKIVQYLANKFFYAGMYNAQRTLEDLSHTLTTIINLGQLAESITRTLTKTLGLQWASIVLIKHDPQGYETTEHWNKRELLADEDVRSELKQRGVPILFDELTADMQETDKTAISQNTRILAGWMQQHDMGVCVPLISHDELTGAIMLGWKKNNESFSHEDVQLLRMVASPAAVAIENAQLYTQSQLFSSRLSREVDLATRDLVKANQNLQDLMKMRTEFLQIASHQLRTPVSVMRGMLDMLRHEKKTLSLEQQTDFLERAFLKSEKLTNIISDILSATEMDVPNFDVASITKPTDLIALIKASVESARKDAGDKGLDIEFTADKPTLLVKGSEAYLPQAITNLIDNAIKYTKKGRVAVHAYQNGHYAVVAVKDTGIGVPPSEQEKLWTKFTRAQNAKDMYTDGSGLGLFIVKKIVEGHLGGKVFMESMVGKGSTFGFKLPMIEKSNA